MVGNYSMRNSRLMDGEMVVCSLKFMICERKIDAHPRNREVAGVISDRDNASTA